MKKLKKYTEFNESFISNIKNRFKKNTIRVEENKYLITKNNIEEVIDIVEYEKLLDTNLESISKIIDLYNYEEYKKDGIVRGTILYDNGEWLDDDIEGQDENPSQDEGEDFDIQYEGEEI